MKIIEDEVIGELRYLTMEFDLIELKTGGVGVISQGAVQRYFTEKNPDLKVKKCGGLKLDYQRNIVTMRIGVVNQLAILTGADGSKIEGEKTVGKDAQKFSDLLVENENLKKQVVALAECAEIDLAPTVKEAEEALAERRKESGPCDCSDVEELDVDLAEVKEAIESADSVPLSEIGSDSNIVLTNDIVQKVCDQAEVVGPDLESEGEGDEDII